MHNNPEVKEMFSKNLSVDKHGSKITENEPWSPKAKLIMKRMKFTPMHSFKMRRNLKHRAIHSRNNVKSVKTPDPPRIKLLDRFTMEKPTLQDIALIRAQISLKKVYPEFNGFTSRRKKNQRKYVQLCVNCIDPIGIMYQTRHRFKKSLTKHLMQQGQISLSLQLNQNPRKPKRTYTMKNSHWMLLQSSRKLHGRRNFRSRVSKAISILQLYQRRLNFVTEVKESDVPLDILFNHE